MYEVFIISSSIFSGEICGEDVRTSIKTSYISIYNENNKFKKLYMREKGLYVSF